MHSIYSLCSDVFLDLRQRFLPLLITTEYFIFFQKIETLEHKMYTHPMQKDPARDSLYELCEKKFKVSTRVSLMQPAICVILTSKYFMFRFSCSSITI